MQHFTEAEKIRKYTKNIHTYSFLNIIYNLMLISSGGVVLYIIRFDSRRFAPRLRKCLRLILKMIYLIGEYSLWKLVVHFWRYYTFSATVTGALAPCTPLTLQHKKGYIFIKINTPRFDKGFENHYIHQLVSALSGFV